MVNTSYISSSITLPFL